MSARETASTTLPGLATLEQTPAVLEGMLAACPKEVFDWKPSPQRWSISEVLAHLAHVEVEGFRVRVKQFVEGRPLGAYDQNAMAAAGTYSGKDGRAMLEKFRAERAETLRFLATLPASALERKARHPELGEVSLVEMMHEWAFHDLGHIRQIAELYRAKAYWPRMGGWQQYYKINP